MTIGDACTVGRASGCDIALIEDGKVSHRHAEIRQAGDGYVVEDLNSRNGTWIERGDVVMRVERAVPLLPADVVRIGSTRLTFDPAIHDDLGPVPRSEGVGSRQTPFEPPPATLILGKTVRRDGAPPPPPTVVRQERPPQTDAERIAQLERQVAELSAELARVKNQSKEES
jgi:pSer/pThr/pTyr-binding forkhead associated (FHA) protein